MDADDEERTKRKILLPSGKIVEVTDPNSRRRDLTRCERCEGRLVQPVEWDAAGQDRWLLTRRCPDCDGAFTDTFSQDEVDHYDIELDLGFRRLEAELVAAKRRAMTDWARRFGTALRGGHLLPEDF